MKTLMIAAMNSGAGKTLTTCALLAALIQRGERMQAFKCGPDYIDPMFHERVLNVPSRNLDLFLQGEEGVIKTLSRAQADLVLIEGAMGYYDGLNNTTDAGAYALARLTGTPAVLVISPGGSGGKLDEILNAIHAANPAARICVSAITLEGLHNSYTALRKLGYETEVTQLSVSRSKPAGGLTLMLAQNPVWLITGYGS